MGRRVGFTNVNMLFAKSFEKFVAEHIDPRYLNYVLISLNIYESVEVINKCLLLVVIQRFTASEESVTNQEVCLYLAFMYSRYVNLFCFEAFKELVSGF